MRVECVLVVIQLQQLSDFRQMKAHVLERCDAPDGWQLVLVIVAVVGEPVDVDRAQQPNLVVMPEHADADSGQLGKISDFQQGGTLHAVHFLDPQVL